MINEQDLEELLIYFNTHSNDEIVLNEKDYDIIIYALDHILATHDFKKENKIG